MTSLRPNLIKRIDRLPKPTSAAAALQPLFEAVSNAIHSTQTRFRDTVQKQGRVVVTISTNRKKEGSGQLSRTMDWVLMRETGTPLRRLIPTINSVLAARALAAFFGLTALSIYRSQRCIAMARSFLVTSSRSVSPMTIR